MKDVEIKGNVVSNKSAVPERVPVFDVVDSNGDIKTVGNPTLRDELEGLTVYLEKERADAEYASNNSMASNREFYYMGVDSALTDAIARITNLVIKDLTSK